MATLKLLGRMTQHLILKLFLSSKFFNLVAHCFLFRHQPWSTVASIIVVYTESNYRPQQLRVLTTTANVFFLSKYIKTLKNYASTLEFRIKTLKWLRFSHEFAFSNYLEIMISSWHNGTCIINAATETIKTICFLILINLLNCSFWHWRLNVGFTKLVLKIMCS